MIKKMTAYLVAVFMTYILSVVIVSQFNIASIAALGYPATMADRITTSWQDLLGMAASYLPLIAIALFIAWLFTGLLLTRFINRSLFLYALAGMTGVMAIHVILNIVFGIHPIAPTRSLAGLISQGMVGAIGGVCFYKLAFRENI